MKQAIAAVTLAVSIPVALLGCDASPTGPISDIPDVVTSAKKGGGGNGGGNGGGSGGGGFTPIPVTVDAAGGFTIAGQAAYITNETAVRIDFASQDGIVTRTTNFELTAQAARASNFAECASKRGQKSGELADAEKERLIAWLEGVTRSGALIGAIDLAGLGTPGSSSVRTRTTDSDPNQHVELGTFGLTEGAEGPTVTQVGPDSWRFTGGVVQMWDRNAPTPQTSTLQCPNHDEVVLTFTR